MPDSPTPEDIAFFEAQAGAAPTALNPIRDFSAEDLAALAVQDKTFNIPEAFRSQPDLHGDQAIVQKSADALNLVKQRGFSLKDLPTVGEAGATVWGAAKGFGKQLWNYANIAGNVVAGSVAEMTGQSGLARGYGENIDARLAQNIAGTEEAMTGLAQLGEKAVGKVGRAVGAMKSYADYTPGEKVADLFADVGRAETSQQRLSGAGVFTSAVTGGTGAETLKRAGVTPEQVGELAAGDPFSFFLFGKGAALAGKAAGAVLPASVKAIPAVVEAAASKALPAIGGGLVEAAGKTAEIGAKGVTTAGKVASVAGPIVGGLSALAGGDITTAGIGGLASGAGGAALKRLGQLAAEQAPKITRLGEQIAGKAPITGATAQFGRDVLQALPGAVGEVAKGAALDLGLAAATAETPQETAGAVGFGTVLGALGGAARIGGHALSGQLIGPRAYGSGKPVPSSGNFPAFDSMHSDAMKSAAPGVQTRLNAIREFLNGAAPGTDVFFGKDAATVESALKQAGVSDATAKLWAAQEGFFTADLPGGRVVVLRNVDAAPHEAFHPIQDVIGEEANRAIDRVVFDVYGDRWDTEGEKYASRLGKRPDASWQETVLDASGWGLTEAKEKLYRDIYNRVVGETGAEPAPGVVAEMAKAALGKVMDEAVTRNPQIEPNEVARHAWREILSPEEAQQVADRYIAREIAGENFDALFKHSGPALMATGVSQRLADIVGNLLSAVGIEPLAGRTSEFGQVPLSTPVIEAVRKAATGERPTVEPAAAPALPKVAAPVAPVQKQSETAPEADAQNAARPEAAEARAIADAAPELPQIGGTKSPRELLGVIAESIAKNEGVKINYLSAPDEPAAATTSNRDVRRAIIEAFRDRPELRQLWEKTFFPEKVIQTKSGKYQIQGWAPEVFAANAHKMAKFLSEVPEAELLSPFKIDSATKTFTVEEWKRLYEVTQQFVKNQMVGYTGAGEPLVVPRSVTEAGGYAPPVKPGAKPIPQAEADFINLLFNFRLPDTPRIVTGKRPLNILAQDVSVATKPGRIRVPVEPREKFAGEEAERQNIAGREILETNPLRNQLEQAASKAGIAMPSMIEAIQKLNLENIKEVAGTPEQPQFRGNTLTLTAGFQPATAAGKSLEKQGYEFRRVGGPANPGIEIFKAGDRVGEILAVRKSPKEADVAMVNVTKPFQGQGISEILYRELGQRLKEEGVSDLTGMIVNERALKSRSKVFPETDIESIQEFGPTDRSYEVRSRIPETAQFNPAEVADRVEKFSPDEFRGWVDSIKGAFTQEAWRVGKEAPDRAFADSLRQRYDALSKRSTETLASLKNLPIDEKMAKLNDLSALASQAQFFREAHEAATGTASAGAALRKADPNYKPPFPPEEVTGQAQPKKELPPESDPLELKPSSNPKSYWLSPEGKLYEAPEDHAAFSKQYISGTPAEALAEKWVRVNVSPMAEQILIESQEGLSRVQRDAMRELAASQKMPVVDDSNTTVIESPESAQFSPKRKNEVSQDYEKLVDKMPYIKMVKKEYQDIAALLNRGFTMSEWNDLSYSDQTIANAILDYEAKRSGSPKKDPRYDFEGLPGYVYEKPASKYSGVSGTAGEWAAVGKRLVEESDIVWFKGVGGTEAVNRVQKKVASGDITPDNLDSQPRPDKDIATELFSLKKMDRLDNAVPVSSKEQAIMSRNSALDPTIRSAIIPEISRAMPPITEPARPTPNTPVTEPVRAVSKTPAEPRVPVNHSYELDAPKAGFSKAWILPSGLPAQLGGIWHHQWLSQNPEIAKKYGLDIPKFEGTDAEGVREAALKKGFGRVNYAQNSGTLTVEARAKDWRKMKSSIERMVESNLDQIDNMSVTLLDETASKVVDSQSAKLFNYDDAEKLQHLPFITEGEVRGQFAPRKGYQADEFWFGAGKAHPAKYGHENFARDYLKKEGIDRDHSADLYDNPDISESQSMDYRDETLSMLQNRGFLRAVREGNELAIDSSSKFESWEQVPPALKRAIEDVAVDQSLVVRFDGEDVADFSKPPSAQFSPESAEQSDLLDVPENTSGKQKTLRREIVTAKAKYPEALPLEYRTNDDGSFRLDAKGKPTPAGIPYGLYDTPLAKQAVKGVRGTTESGTPGKLRIEPEDLDKPTYQNERAQLDFGAQFSPGDAPAPAAKAAATKFVPMPQDDAERIADAIYIAEGGAKAKKPYGILSVSVSTEAEARKVALNTIKNNYKRWHDAGRPGEYLAFLANRYAPTKNATNDPTGLNNNWLKNVRRLLKSEVVVEPKKKP